MPSRASILTLLVLVLTGTGLGAQSLGYPEIIKLSSAKDPLFRQLSGIVDLAYQALASGEKPGDMALFQYRIGANDSIFTLASRFNLPYDCLLYTSRCV